MASSLQSQLRLYPFYTIMCGFMPKMPLIQDGLDMLLTVTDKFETHAPQSRPRDMASPQVGNS